MSNWIDDFVHVHSNSETPVRILQWVGVSTIAGALRRKVWIQEDGFQWTSNFYIVLVAPPGLAKKSTSMDCGKRLLRECEDIHFGPNVATWQAIVEELGGAHDVTDINGDDFESANMTVFSSEFGSLFDSDDRKSVDVLTDLWDGKLDTFIKSTKSSGTDTIKNPWINLFGCTTPTWITNNMPESLIGSGFVCRCIWLYTDNRERRIAYPSRQRKDDLRDDIRSLVDRLKCISMMAGEFKMTPKAYSWGEKWYEDYCDYIDKLQGTMEADFAQRRQTHLHKLAMIVSAATRSDYMITLSDMEYADSMIKSIEQDAGFIFGFIGQTESAKYSNMVVNDVRKTGWIAKQELFRKYYFRKVSFKDFEIALNSAIASGYIKMMYDNGIIMVGPK